MMRQDGHIVIFVIKHVHPSTIRKGWDGVKWDGSGNCSQFELRNRKMELYKPISASGNVWQAYGICGTQAKHEAVDIAKDMSENFPDYYWGVFKIELMQKTTEVAVFK